MTANNPAPDDLRNLSPEALRYLLDQDFRTTWDALASDPEIHARGNFMFGREAVGLLELASRVCAGDASGQALADFAAELERVKPRYFTLLPAPAPGTREFALPSAVSKGLPTNQLISAIFDLIRNGQAHQRQQIMVETTDNKTFGISLTGAGYGRALADRTLGGRPSEHLSLLVDEEGNVFLVVCPEILFLDLHTAITASGIFHRGLKFEYLNRPRPGSNQYSFSASDVHQALIAGGHAAYQQPRPQPTARLPNGGAAVAAPGEDGSDPALRPTRQGGRRQFAGGLAIGVVIGGLISEALRRR